jgi:hypothetical protein
MPDGAFVGAGAGLEIVGAKGEAVGEISAGGELSAARDVVFEVQITKPAAAASKIHFLPAWVLVAAMVIALRSAAATSLVRFGDSVFIMMIWSLARFIQ